MHAVSQATFQTSIFSQVQAHYDIIVFRSLIRNLIDKSIVKEN